MAKRGEGLGETIAAVVKAQVSTGLDGLAKSVEEAVASAKSALGSVGPLVNEAVRETTDVEVLKALADPTRIAILRALMDDSETEVGERVMAAKELAEELGEPQTKLYRHLKVLEAQGLIEVAETRIVSGIVETRYKAGQKSLFLGPDDVDMSQVGEEMTDLVSAGIESFRQRFVAEANAGHVKIDPDAPIDHRKPAVFLGNGRLTPERADAFRVRLGALIEEFAAESNVPGGVPIEALLISYSPYEAPRRTGPEAG
jgi:DNA-binding transcriptional ArsR family regulator